MNVIERILGPGFVAGLGKLPMGEVRARRDLAAQEETDLSYLRRLLHARIDIVRAEQRRRQEGSSAPVVAELAAILAENAIAPATGSGRHQPLQPSQAEAHRRRIEALVHELDVAPLGRRELLATGTSGIGHGRPCNRHLFVRRRNAGTSGASPCSEATARRAIR